MRWSRPGWAIAGIVALFSFLDGGASEAASSAWLQDDVAAARLVSAGTAVDRSGHVILGLQIRLEEGWKTYWRHPGESGVPPRFSWEDSENIGAVQVQWPTPERFRAFGLNSIGYSHEVVLPLHVRVADPDAPLKVSLQLDYMICKDICVPLSGALTVSLPGAAAAAEPTAFALLIDRYQKKVPLQIAENAKTPIRLQAIARTGAPGKETLKAQFVHELGFTAPDLLFDLLRDFDLGKPEMILSADRKLLEVIVPIEAFEASRPSIAGETVRLTLIDGVTAVDLKWRVPPA